MDTNYNNDQLERDIENAIRARGLKEQMQQWDEEEKRKSSKQWRWRKARRWLYSLSVVAAVALVLICIVPASTWRQAWKMGRYTLYQQYARYFHKPSATYKNSSEDILLMAQSDIAEIGERNSESHALGANDPIAEITGEMQNGNYALAHRMLEDVELDESEPRYEETQVDVEYLCALCELGLAMDNEEEVTEDDSSKYCIKRGKTAKQRRMAKRMLEEIAQSESRHAPQAAALVEEFK